jgi:hypothetical protein
MTQSREKAAIGSRASLSRISSRYLPGLQKDPRSDLQLTADLLGAGLLVGPGFGTAERFWMNLQTRYDLEIEKDRLGAVLDEIHPLSPAS